MSAMTNIETNGKTAVKTAYIPASTSVQSAPTVSHGVELPELELGLAGEAVRFAQQRLMAYGYRIGFNGQYGPQMKAAVEHFQAYYGGLVIDGIIGENTWTALCDQELPRLGWTFYSPLKNTKYAYNIHMPELKEGHVGDAVECLQLRLYAKGFSLFIDGDFGPRTLEVVTAFQYREGLAVDGIVGEKTWRKLGE